MSMLKTVTADITTVNKGTPVAFNASPFTAGKNCLVTILAIPLTSVVVLETAPRFDPATGTTPAAASTLWTTLKSYSSASTLAPFELTPNYWVRYNCTTLDADGPVITWNFEGVQ